MILLFFYKYENDCAFVVTRFVYSVISETTKATEAIAGIQTRGSIRAPIGSCFG